MHPKRCLIASFPSVPKSRRFRRSWNSEPFPYAATLITTGKRRVWTAPPLPSSLPQEQASDAKACAINKKGSRFPMRQKGRGWVRVFRFSPVIPAAAGIQNPDYVPSRLCQIRRAGWTGLRPNWNIPADTNQVGWGKGSGFPLRRELPCPRLGHP